MVGVIGVKETVIAFGMVGIDYLLEITDETSGKDLENFLNNHLNDITLLIVDEYTYDKFEEIFEKYKRHFVIIEIPCYGYKGRSRERFKKLVKEAFGIELKI